MRRFNMCFIGDKFLMLGVMNFWYVLILVFFFMFECVI